MQILTAIQYELFNSRTYIIIIIIIIIIHGMFKQFINEL